MKKLYSIKATSRGFFAIISNTIEADSRESALQCAKKMVEKVIPEEMRRFIVWYYKVEEVQA